MCGIAGILRVHPPNSDIPPPLLAIPEAWLDILDDSIKHRGPDGKGRFRDRAIRPDGSIVDVALVHRRLSILDHAAGHQPMVSPRRGAGILTTTRASGPRAGDGNNAKGGGWLLYESPDDPALHAWNEALQRTRSAGSSSSSPTALTGEDRGGVGVSISERAPHTTPGATPRVAPDRGVPIARDDQPQRARNASEGSSTSLTSATKQLSDDSSDMRGVPGGGAPGLSAPSPAPSASTASSDDLVAVAFNGCIYNHRQLRRDLIAAGHTFTSDHSDTEVLVHGWRAFNVDLIKRLDGMFAALIWDRGAGTLAMFRDRAGEKPLYYTPNEPESIAFSSSLPGIMRLRAHRGLKPTLGCTQLNPIDLWTRHGYSIEGILDSLPLDAVEHPHGVASTFGYYEWSELLEDEPNRGAFEPLWANAPPPEARTNAVYQRDDGLAFLDEQLEHAVRMHLNADVPVGVFLSGGIDSSLITHYARKHADVAAFCVRMPDPRYDESRHASAVAKRLGVPLTLLDAGASPAEDLPRLIHELGLPFGDSSLLPTHWLCRAARQHVKVALGGDGGDELFAGYDRHAIAPWLRRLSPLLRVLPEMILPARDPKALSTKARRLIEAAKGDGYTDLSAIFPTALYQRLVPGRTGLNCVPGPIGDLDKTDPPRLDFEVYLPGDLMRKVDTASMSVALEVRSPMLANRLVASALSEQLSSLMPHGQRKGLLKQVARKYLPPDIVDRPKQGFAIPIGDWFRSDFGSLRQLLRDHLLAPEPFGPDALGINAMINMNYVRQMLKEHDDAGTRSLWPWKGRDHSQRLYMLLVLSIWAKWLGGLSSAPHR